MINVKNITNKIAQAHESGMISAFAYDRISDKQQADGLSLDYQESHAAQYSERAGLGVVHYFTVIESARGTTIRKTFNRMIDLALQYGVKDLIFKNTDRMSRNYGDLLRIEELVEKHGFNIHFYQTHRVLNKKSTYADKFILAVEIAAARQLSDKLSHDTMENQRFKAGRGVAPLGSPIGYRYDKDKRAHVIDRERENFIRFFFDEFDEGGYSLRSFAALLNEKGYRTARGKKWDVSSVAYTLTNPFYHGEFIFQGKIWPGAHEPYYPKERYDERMRRMGRGPMWLRPVPGMNRHYHDFPFSRILRCSACGKMLTGELKKGKYQYYMHACSERRLYLPAAVIGPAIDEAISQVAFGDDFAALLKDLFRQSVKTRKAEQSELAALSRKISDLEVQQDKILALYSVDGMDLDAVNRTLSKFRQEIARLTEQRAALRIDHHDFIVKVDSVIEMAKQFPLIYRNASEAQKGDMLHPLIDCVKIDGEAATIEWRKPFAFVLDPALIRFKDKVRSRTGRRAELHKLRTSINQKSLAWRLWMAG
jgi:DNA invertase Pin-like site-specific DNA recombinase